MIWKKISSISCILERLSRGKSRWKSPEIKQYGDQVCEDIEYLRKLLDENGRKVLERLLDNGSEIERFQIKESFKDGFRLGMQLTAAGLHNQKQL